MGPGGKVVRGSKIETEGGEVHQSGRKLRSSVKVNDRSLFLPRAFGERGMERVWRTGEVKGR